HDLHRLPIARLEGFEERAEHPENEDANLGRAVGAMGLERGAVMNAMGAQLREVAPGREDGDVEAAGLSKGPDGVARRHRYRIVAIDARGDDGNAQEPLTDGLHGASIRRPPAAGSLRGPGARRPYRTEKPLPRRPCARA